MRKTAKIPLPPLPAPSRPGNLPAQVVTDVLESSARLRRLTHDVGFHRQRVTLLASVFDGTHILTGGAEGTVRLWEAASGRCVRVFFCRKSPLRAIFTTPNRNRMITVSPFGGKKVWDLDSGDCLADLPYHEGFPVHCDDTYFYCKLDWNVQSLFGEKRPETKRSEVRVCEVDTGKTVLRLEIEDSHIRSLAVDPDSRKIAVVSDDHCLRIWDLPSGTLLRQLNGYTFRDIIGISPDSRYIVLNSAETIDVLEMTRFGITFTKAKPTCYDLPRYALRGFLLIERTMNISSLEQTSIVRAIDIRTGATMHTGRFGGDIEVRSVTKEGRFCLGFRDGRMDVWDLRNHEATSSIALDPLQSRWTTQFHAAPLKGERIALSRRESVVRIIEPSSGRLTGMIPASDPVRDVVVTPDGKGLLTMGASGVKVWDLARGRCLGQFAIPIMPFWDDLPENSPLMAVTPDAKGLLLPSENGVTLLELSTGRCMREYSLRGLPGSSGAKGYPGPFALYVTADGKRLVVVSVALGIVGSCNLYGTDPVAVLLLKGAGRLKTFRMGEGLFATSEGDVLSLWDVQKGKLLRQCDQESFIEDALFLASRGGVVTTNLSAFHFWECETGELLTKSFYGNAMSIRPDHMPDRWLSPVPGDRQFIVHSSDTIALYDMETDQIRWQDDDSWRKNRVRKTVAFPDGKRFAALDAAGAVEVRNIETGETLATLTVLPRGFIWETPPDDHAPSGWLWTDREDLISVIARSRNDRDTKASHHGDGEHTAYLKIYNNRRMVVAKIAGKEQYRRNAELHARALDRARIGIGCGRSGAPLSLPPTRTAK